MKAPTAKLVFAALCALSLVASAPAQARDYRGGHGHGGYHGHARIHYGFYFGAPLYSPWYYPPPYYYYPQTIVVPTSPPVYVERGDEQAAPAQDAQSWWYYCPESKTYYPYVKQCPGGWQKVAPQPPAQ